MRGDYNVVVAIIIGIIIIPILTEPSLLSILFIKSLEWPTEISQGIITMCEIVGVDSSARILSSYLLLPFYS